MQSCDRKKAISLCSLRFVRKTNTEEFIHEKINPTYKTQFNLSQRFFCRIQYKFIRYKEIAFFLLCEKFLPPNGTVRGGSSLDIIISAAVDGLIAFYDQRRGFTALAVVFTIFLGYEFRIYHSESATVVGSRKSIKASGHNDEAVNPRR